MSYLNKTITIPLVDKNDKDLGPIERWEAHKENILHRGFTVCILYKNCVLLQHRKHPAFGGMFDLTSSSHQTITDGRIQPIEDAVSTMLKREWIIDEDIMSTLIKKGSFIYQARDEISNLYEYEICHFFTVSINSIPQIHYDYAYGFSVVDISTMQNSAWPGRSLFVPWAQRIVDLYFK